MSCHTENEVTGFFHIDEIQLYWILQKGHTEMKWLKAICSVNSDKEIPQQRHTQQGFI